MSVSLPWLGARATRSLPSARRASAWGWLRALLPGLTLTALTAYVFWSDLVAGQAFYGSDTLAFYYPLTVWYAEELRAGRLPLWFPYIFGGYPLFADGEVGMLYPLHLLAYGLLEPERAFVLLRPLHFWLAGLFTFWWARLIGQGRFGATLAGLAFSYGSFLVSHLQHENIVRSTIWLPLALVALERAFRQRGWARSWWLIACGLVLAVQMLGVHVQPVLLSMVVLPVYALFAPLGGPAARRSWLHGGWRRLPRPEWAGLPGFVASRALSIGLVFAVALGLAAVQLLPLYALGERSMRSGGVSYEFSTSYSIPPLQLVQVVLPYLFRPDQSSYWGLWSPIETTLYFGVAPLLLALVALAYLRTRAVAFLGLLAGISLLLALGDYLPFKLYGLIWTLPGFSFLRVPARFSMLTVLAGAALAGFAADWLAGQAFDRPVSRPRPSRRRLMALGLAFSSTAAGLAVLFFGLRALLASEPGVTRSAIETLYLTLRRGELGLSASTVYFGLLRSIDLGNPRTVGGLTLMLLAAALLVLRGGHHLPRRVWQPLLGLVVVVDLAIFAQGFYPSRPVQALNPQLPVLEFLAERNGLHRVFAEPQLYRLLGPNLPTLAGIDLAGGYSSLEPRRATEYWWSVVRQDNLLLDLLNVRYVVAPRNVEGLVAFDGTLFHPGDRLMHGAVGNPSGVESFVTRPWWTQAVTVVGAFEAPSEIPVGEALLEVEVAGPDGQQLVRLHAHQHLGESRGRVPGSGSTENPAARTIWPSRPVAGGPVLYGVTLPLEQPLMATRVTLRRVGAPAIVDVHGVGLHDRAGLPVRSLQPTDREKYHQVYEDDDVRIFENLQSLPRAYLVGSARPANGPGTPVEELHTAPFDPRTTALIDGPVPPDSRLESLSGGGGRAEVVEYAPTRVLVRSQSNRSGLLVLSDRYDDGWRALVDGEPAPILRANGMFRAVPVPAGNHDVLFQYDPPAVRQGALLTLATLGLLVLLGAVWAAHGWRSSRRLTEEDSA